MIAMSSLYRFRQWVHRLSGDHDELTGSPRKINSAELVSLTQAEVNEGLSL